MASVRRALLSCYDKTGLEVFAKHLVGLGVELVASTGTGEFLRQHGLQVRTLEAFAGITEQLDGRVKTLHPKIHAGILALRDHPAHMAMVDPDALIDLVVVNLYPFQQAVQQPHVNLHDALEHIDIGGVALLRAAAKNFSHVAVVCQPQQYQEVADALQQGHGELSTSLKQRLAVRAFELSGGYDRLIAEFLGSGGAEVTSFRLRQRQPLRYGENPHQQGAWYVPASGTAWGVATITQQQGKELSYNNLLDLDAAVRCLVDFDEPTCVILKHNAPCGLASAGTLVQAYDAAQACDSEAAFGGVVGCNRPLDAALANRLIETFLEVIVAPSVSPEAAALLSRKPKMRVVTLDWPSRSQADREWRHLLGGWLMQEPDGLTVNPETLRVVTNRAPSPRERADLLFAWNAVKHTKSNGIVIAHGTATQGIGQGQPSRVGSVRLAVQQAGARAKDAVAASDAFFPFPDGVELLAQAGVRAIIQPGGSIRDTEVVQAANHAKLAMLFTGIRHFRH